jgi:predicted transcriptional regulator of viral defense system
LLKIAIIRNNLSYQLVQKELQPFKVFSLIDVKKAFPGFDSKRLVEWQEKGFIKKLINKWYLFLDVPLTEHLCFRISNCLHHPSYISLESALAYYQMIPEAAFSFQAVSTRKTTTYNTPAGTFNYRTVKPQLYFGYTIHHTEGFPALIAEPEKAILDFLYLNHRLQTPDDIYALRLNYYTMQELINWEKLLHYAKVFNSATLDKKVKLLKKIVSNAYPS